MCLKFFSDVLNALTHPFIAQGLLSAFVLLEGIQCTKKAKKNALRRINKILLMVLFSYAFYAHVCVDPRYLFVMQNNHPAQAIHYRIASLWSHHETSLFVWLVILNITTYIIRLPQDIAQFRERILELLNCLFGFYMLVAANPFEMTPLAQLTQESQGLNPLLYDINMVWHPPLLYLGVTWLFTPYVLSLWLHRTGDTAFLSVIQQQTKTAFGFLTLAIALGSFWAFTQLGWGGFWFWDPVETASLLPWLSALIVFHATPLTIKKHPWVGCLPFGAVMLSLWAVRSGILVSVHSFAHDAIAFWLLGSLMTFTWVPVLMAGLSSLCKQGFDSTVMQSAPPVSPGLDPEIYNRAITNTREAASNLQTICDFNNKDPQAKPKDDTIGFKDNKNKKAGITSNISSLNIGIYLLSLTLLLLFLGLFVPVTLGFSVAPSFFNTVLLPIWIVIALLMARGLYTRFHFNTSTTTILFGCIAYLTFYSHLSLAYLLLGVSGTVCASGMIPIIKEKPRVALAHMGIGLCLIGLASYSDSPPETTLTLSRNIPLTHQGYQLTFKDVHEIAEPFKTNQYASITIQAKENSLILMPARLFFHSSKLQRVKSDFGLLNQHIVMITNSETLPDGHIAITFHEKMGLLWLVFGCCLILASLIMFSFSKTKKSNNNKKPWFFYLANIRRKY